MYMNPMSFDQAISSDESINGLLQWKKNLNKYNMMKSRNKVSFPEGLKLIGYKWVFKIKKILNGRMINRRLVAKEFT